MKKPGRSIVLGLCAVAGIPGVCSQRAHAQGPDASRLAQAASPAPAATDADAAILALLEEDFLAQMEASPLAAGRRGLAEFNALLPDDSAPARERRLAATRDRLARLRAIDGSSASEANRVNAALLAYELELRLDAARFDLWRLVVTPLSSPITELAQLPDQQTFTTRADRESYVKRLEAVPEYLKQAEESLRAGLKAGLTPPREVMGATPDPALALGDARYETPGAAREHTMFRPLAGAEPDLMERGERAIAAGIVPAMRRFGEFLRDEYVPGCRVELGITSVQGGLELYDYYLRYFTTRDLTAQQIHETGLAEVARIRAEMMAVIARSDFPRRAELSGDELFSAFVAYLRSDPRFYYTEPNELLDGYRVVCKNIDAELPRFFGKLPRLPYGVREMPRFLAPTSPTAYYYPGSMRTGVPGYFVVNTHKLDQRPRYEMIPLAIHEAAPGHHLQFALAMELTDAGLPRWRELCDYTSFVEGWALYAERLGLEMGGGQGDGPGEDRGFYHDPYDDFGRLSYEMWRALRLVVDTGIHAQGWSRQRAIDYMLANSALSKENVEREVDRYIVWPGQATAYKIGELAFRAMRERAEAELGAQFDVRAYHDELLRDGVLPLGVLEQKMARWVEQQKQR